MNNNNIINMHEKNSVYKLKCDYWNKVYIGQTKKKLKDRYKEHFNAYKKPEIYKSNFASHCINNNHLFPNIDNMILIKEINKGLRMNIYEALEIHKYNTNNELINEQIQVKSKFDNIFSVCKVRAAK